METCYFYEDGYCHIKDSLTTETACKRCDLNNSRNEEIEHDTKNKYN